MCPQRRVNLLPQLPALPPVEMGPLGPFWSTQSVSLAWAKFPCADTCVTWRNTWLIFVPTSDFIGIFRLCYEDQERSEAKRWILVTITVLHKRRLISQLFSPLIIVLCCLQAVSDPSRLSQRNFSVNKISLSASYCSFSVYKPFVKVPSDSAETLAHSKTKIQ